MATVTHPNIVNTVEKNSSVPRRARLAQKIGLHALGHTFHKTKAAASRFIAARRPELRTALGTVITALGMASAAAGIFMASDTTEQRFQATASKIMAPNSAEAQSAPAAYNWQERV